MGTVSVSVSGIPRKHAHSLQRLHSLAFVFGTFAYAKDRASSSLDGLLKEHPIPYSLKINAPIHDNKETIFQNNPYFVYARYDKLLPLGDGVRVW